MVRSSPSCIALYSPDDLSVELVFPSHLVNLTYGHIDRVCHSQPQYEMVQKVQRSNERTSSQLVDENFPGTSGLAIMDQRWP